MIVGKAIPAPGSAAPPGVGEAAETPPPVVGVGVEVDAGASVGVGVGLLPPIGRSVGVGVEIDVGVGVTFEIVKVKSSQDFLEEELPEF